MTLRDAVRGFSEQELEDYKTRLPGLVGAMEPGMRDTLLEQLRQIPGLYEEPTPQVQQPAQQQYQWWEYPLGAISNVLEPIQEHVFTPIMAGLAEPAVTGKLGWSQLLGPLAGLVTHQPGTEARERYEQLQGPEVTIPARISLPWTPEEQRKTTTTIGIKEVSEQLPWFLLPTVGGVVGKLGAVAKGGGRLAPVARVAGQALKPAAAVEKAIAYPITKPLEAIAKKVVPKFIDKTARLIPDLQPVDEAIAIAMQPSKLRDLVNVSLGGKHPLKGLGEAIAGRAATADNPATLGLLGRAILHFEGANKATVASASLSRLKTSKQVFGLDDVNQFATGELKGTHIDTLLTYPEKYVQKLTQEQRAWVEQYSLLSKEIKPLLERNGIKVPELTFMEGGQWVGRKVVGKYTKEGELLETALIGGQVRKGGKLGLLKERIFENIEDAITEGFKYMPPEEALYHNIIGAYKSVADRQFADWFLERVPWVKASAKTRKYGAVEAPDIPAFAGKVFTGPEAKGYMNIIRKELDPALNSALNAVNQVNAVGRFFALAADASPFAIQLIFMAGYNPKAYVKAMGGFVKALFDPLYGENMLAKNADLLAKHRGLITTLGGVTEMTELAAKGGLLRKQPFRLGGKILQLERFARGFEGALDTAGVELAKSLDYLATTPARTAQVDAFINEFRGLASTTRLGISSTQRQIERAIILAPQYNRAIGALVFDISQGNLRGQLARRAVGQGTAALMAMTVAISYAFGEDLEQIADHLNPTSSNFMTWDIAGQRVGPGSKVRSLLAMFGKIVENPEDAAYYAGRFLKGNFSPFLGTSMDLITGKDFMGDRSRDTLMQLTETVLAQNLLPIWIQSVALDGGDLSAKVTRGLAEFGGLRAYPAGAYVGVLEKQDELAQKQYGMTWDELGQQPEGYAAQMSITRESSELQTLSTKAEEESGKWARGEQLVWNAYGREVDEIGTTVSKELNAAARAFESTGDGSELRDRVNRAYWLKAQWMNNILDRDEFAVVKDAFNNPLTEQQRANMQPQKLLYRDYNELMYSDDMFDTNGVYRWDEADRRRALFVQMYGQEGLTSVDMVIGERRADEPDAVKLLRQARKILEPYWEIENQVWAQAPPGLKEIADEIERLENTDPRAARRLLFQHPQIVMIRSRIAQYKRMLKARNPQIASALQMFYSY